MPWMLYSAAVGLPLFRPSDLFARQSVRSPSTGVLSAPSSSSSRALQSKTFTIRRISRMHFVPVCTEYRHSVSWSR